MPTHVRKCRQLDRYIAAGPRVLLARQHWLNALKMRVMTTETQGSRSHTLAPSVTPTEKRAVDFVASAEGCPVSELLREYALPDLIGHGGRTTQQLPKLADAA